MQKQKKKYVKAEAIFLRLRNEDVLTVSADDKVDFNKNWLDNNGGNV